MVHSGPFNGLCEIESSRGSPGISNIFLPMLQLLRTIPLFSLLSLPPLVSSYPLPQRLLHISPSYHPTKTTLIDPRRHDPPPGSRSSLRKIRSGCERISEFPWPRETQMNARTRRCPNSFVHVPYIPHITSVADARGRVAIWGTYRVFRRGS